MKDMIFDNEIVSEMARITAEQAESPLAPLPIDESQFSSLAPVETDIDLNAATVAYVEHAIVKDAVDYDHDDKDLLSEKKRALEVGDIVEEAHPETAFMADGPEGTGVVENQNEQHTKILNTIYKMPTGFHFNTFAELLHHLNKVATELEEKGDTKAAAQVDRTTAALVALKKKDLTKEADLSDKQFQQFQAEESGGFKGRSPNEIETMKRQLERERARRAPGGAAKPKTTTPGTPFTQQPKPGDVVKYDPAAAGKGPKARLPGSAQTALTKVKTPKGLSGNLAKSVKGGGGKVGAILSIVGLGVSLLGLLNVSSDDIVTNSNAVAAGATNPQLKQEAAKLAAAVEAAKGKESVSLDEMAAIEEQAQRVALLGSREPAEVQQSINSLVNSVDELGANATKYVNKQVQEGGEKLQGEQERVAGLQEFFRRHFDQNVIVNGLLDKATRDTIHNFVEEMRNDLSIAPRFLTVKNVMKYGNEDMLEKLFDIWQKPHNYAKRSAA